MSINQYPEIGNDAFVTLTDNGVGGSIFDQNGYDILIRQ